MEVAASLGLDGQLDFIERGLQSKDWSMRAKACQLAASLGPAAAASSAAELIEIMLNDGDSEVRHAAVLAMQTFPVENKAEAAQRLCVDGLRYELESLNSSRRNVKSAACAALALLGHDVGLPYLQDVQACLRDRSSLVKKHAATVLAAWGSPVAHHENAHAVIQELGRMAIGDRDPTVRAASCDALGNVLAGAPELPPLPRPEEEAAAEAEEEAEATAESDAKPPEADAEGEDAEARPRARTRTDTDTDEELQPLAVSVRYIARLLQSDEYASVRRAAAAALGTIGGDVSAAQAECLFVATLQDPGKEVRLTAAAALTKLGGLYTQQIAEALAMALEGGEDDLATKLAAVEALCTQGPCALQHATAVGTALLDVDEDVRELAALTLLSVEFPDGEALSPVSAASSAFELQSIPAAAR